MTASWALLLLVWGLVAAGIVVVTEWLDRHEARRWERHCAQAVALTLHPAGPVGPEDHPDWGQP